MSDIKNFEGPIQHTVHSDHHYNVFITRDNVIDGLWNCTHPRGECIACPFKRFCHITSLYGNQPNSTYHAKNMIMEAALTFIRCPDLTQTAVSVEPYVMEQAKLIPEGTTNKLKQIRKTTLQQHWQALHKCDK